MNSDTAKESLERGSNPAHRVGMPRNDIPPATAGLLLIGRQIKVC